MSADVKDGVAAPEKKNDHHDGGDLHDLQSLVAGLLEAFDVLPPVVEGDDDRAEGGGEVHGQLRNVMVCAQKERGQPVMRGADFQQLVEEAGDVLAGRHTGDRTGEDVVEHQGGDADLGEGAAESLLDHAVDAAAGEHGAAFDVDRANGTGEENDADDEPGGGLADQLLGDAAGIKRGGAEVVEHDGGGAPEGDERQHDRGGNDEAYATRRGCCDCFLEGHSVLTSGGALCLERSSIFPAYPQGKDALLPARRTRLSVERMDRSVN